MRVLIGEGGFIGLQGVLLGYSKSGHAWVMLDILPKHPMMFDAREYVRLGRGR